MAFSSKSVSYKLKVSSLFMHLVIILFFTLILGAKSITTGSKADLMQIISSEKESCHFEESHKLYNVSDLLRCLNSLASSVLFQNTLRLTEERAASGLARGNPYSEVTSGYTGQQDNELVKPGSSDHEGLKFPPERQSGYYVPESGHGYYSSQTGPGSSENPNSGFFNALSSISQYDDFKCVPRILCEATSGVVPGTSSYKQTSLFESFGQNALLGLLSAFDASASSPLITFAKAAILGYSSRGNPYSCYREYPKCPRNYDSLIHYLNNHKGGFFRFLSGLTGGYRSFSLIPSEQTETENLYLGKLNKIPLVLDADDTNNKELEEEPSSRQEEYSLKPSLAFPSDDNKSELEKVVFPIIGQTDNQPYRVSKSLNFYPDFSSTSNSVTHKRTSFFPQICTSNKIKKFHPAAIRGSFKILEGNSDKGMLSGKIWDCYPSVLSTLTRWIYRVACLRDIVAPSCLLRIQMLYYFPQPTSKRIALVLYYGDNSSLLELRGDGFMAAYHTLSAETNPAELKPMQRSPFDSVATLQGGGGRGGGGRSAGERTHPQNRWITKHCQPCQTKSQLETRMRWG